MAAQLTELRSRLMLPADTPEAETASKDAEALGRHWISRTELAAATDRLEQQPQLGQEVFARGASGASEGRAAIRAVPCGRRGCRGRSALGRHVGGW